MALVALTLLELVRNQKKRPLGAEISLDYLEVMQVHLLGEDVEEEMVQDVPLFKIEDLHVPKKKRRSLLHRTAL